MKQTVNIGFLVGFMLFFLSGGESPALAQSSGIGDFFKGVKKSLESAIESGSDAVKKGTKAVGKGAKAVGKGAKAVGKTTVDTVIKTGKMVSELKLVEEIGPADEFYIGREAAARLIGKSRTVSPRTKLSIYLNQVGSTLALAGHAPYLYRPYTYIVIRSRAINAFAAPGGIIIITEGMLKFLRDEDELAFILGHELGHVELDHGIAASENNKGLRLASGMAVGGVNLVSEMTGTQENKLLSQIEASLNQLTEKIKNGYSASVEGEADQRSVELMWRVGYDPSAAIDVIRRFKTRTQSYGGAGYPDERLGDLRKHLRKGAMTKRRRKQSRATRYKSFVRTIAALPGDEGTRLARIEAGATRRPFVLTRQCQAAQKMAFAESPARSACR